MIDPHDFQLLLMSDDRRFDLMACAVASVDRRFVGTDTVLSLFEHLTHPVGDVEELMADVFGRIGFRGNSADYYAAENSLIDRVLLHRRGNPLALSIVCVELARRADIALDVVGMPGHVIVGDPSRHRWFDAFAGGRTLDRSDLEVLHGRLFPDKALDERTLAPLTPSAAAARMLQNLRVSAQQAGDPSRLASVLELRVAIPGSPASDRLDLANVLMQVGRFEQAATHHDRLAELRPHRADAHQAAAERCRAHSN